MQKHTNKTKFKGHILTLDIRWKMSGELMALTVINKINCTLKFLFIGKHVFDSSATQDII